MLQSREFNNFDHNNRKWIKTTINDKKFKELLSSESNVVLSNLLDNTEFASTINYPNFSDINLYNVIRNLCLGTNNVLFRILGSIGRDAGQVVNLDCQTAKFNTLVGGGWFIFGCKHIWENEEYINELECFRTISKIPLSEDVK